MEWQTTFWSGLNTSLPLTPSATLSRHTRTRPQSTNLDLLDNTRPPPLPLALLNRQRPTSASRISAPRSRCLGRFPWLATFGTEDRVVIRCRSTTTGRDVRWRNSRYHGAKCATRCRGSTFVDEQAARRCRLAGFKSFSHAFVRWPTSSSIRQEPLEHEPDCHPVEEEQCEAHE